MKNEVIEIWLLKDMEKSFKMLVRYRSNHKWLLKMKRSWKNTLKDLMEKAPVKKEKEKSEKY